MNKFKIRASVAFLTTIFFSIVNVIPAFAVMTQSTLTQAEEAELRKSMPVESNEIENWPQGPLIGAESAILMEVDTGVVLYEKNVHEKLYPASTTKLLTSLIASEHTTMDEIVTFSHDSVFNIERDSSHIGIDVGEQLTMEQCLYGILLGSANEVAYAVAEHVGGSLEGFVSLMNERASALGCVDTHFSNANGLPDPNHYTTAYDLALIARECYKNEIISKISGTTYYTIPPTNKQVEERPLTNHHLLLPKLKYAYDYMLGGKTGYTTEARQTLVTCAEKDGLKLICVIMKEESPYQFLDTVELFDYGFDNFMRLNIAANETNYSMNNANFFHSNIDILGDSKPLLTINKNGEIILPKTAVFTDAVPEIKYMENSMTSVATLNYYFNQNYIGSTTIDYVNEHTGAFEFSNIIDSHTDLSSPKPLEKETKTVFVNIKTVIIIILVVFGIILIMFIIRTILNNVYFTKRKRRRSKKKNYKYRSRYENVKF
ncbi:MAG: D-alanyl-D-alanine carboxypeptidase [Clostridia bacterium]|nr:D-alanyl-D-alanine carboxypeptidase [Clostridia bacterium]